MFLAIDFDSVLVHDLEDLVSDNEPCSDRIGLLGNTRADESEKLINTALNDFVTDRREYRWLISHRFFGVILLQGSHSVQVIQNAMRAVI